jgi:DNA mismatch repair ATPase MutS
MQFSRYLKRFYSIKHSLSKWTSLNSVSSLQNIQQHLKIFDQLQNNTGYFNVNLNPNNNQKLNLFSTLKRRIPHIGSKTTQLTATMQQYVDLKTQYPSYLLMFRIGDFYELFFEDAVIASKELDIRLTSKNNKNNNTKNVTNINKNEVSLETEIHSSQSLKVSPIPMAGVPAHAIQTYVQKLIQKGFTVAICDQLETAEEAKKHKRTIRREITRLITPGTALDDGILKATEPNFLASVVDDKEKTENVAVAWCDLSTGEIFVSETQGMFFFFWKKGK